MNGTRLMEVQGGKFSGTLDHHGDRLLVTCKGVAEMDAVSTVTNLLERADAEAQRLNIRTMSIDLRVLDFMNSSCFRAFVSLVGAVRDLPEDKRYTLSFTPAPGRHWQSRSLYVLQCLAFECVQIEGASSTG